MNLKDLSKVVSESIQECIDRKFNIEDVEIYMVDGDYALCVNSAQLRFSDVVTNQGILLLDNVD